MAGKNISEPEISKIVLHNIFTGCYNMKFILPCPRIKLHSETHNTAENCTTKCTTPFTIKFIEKLVFLCVLFY